jgi:Virulence-associated protein E
MANDNEDNKSGEDEPDGPDFDSAAEASDAIKRAKLKTLEGMEQDEAARSKARSTIMDLVERGKKIASEEAVCYPNLKSTNQGMIVTALPTDPNRWVAFDALFGNGEDRPHIDTFRGRLVDHRGEIIDDHYSMVDLTRALNVMGLKGHSAREVRNAFKEWALMIKQNDLVLRFEKVIPTWDGQPRMEMALIDVFECKGTELNRSFSKYFWLSIYNRIMNPGCLAPMVLCLIGEQFTGKSHFANIICQAILGRDYAHAVKLDLAKDWTPFLRQITGNSIIANVGEMTGYNRGDLTKIKDFITQESDPFDYKYEGHIDQQRQWIIVMDGNSYDGLQRDETGNRRFYPMFVGEAHIGSLDTLRGKWTGDYCASIAATIWPIMAECKEWMSKNGGFNGYLNFVKDVTNDVFDFNKNEMDNDRGTIRDEDLDIFLIPALVSCKYTILNRPKNKGLFIYTDEIVNRVGAVSRDKVRVKTTHLPTKMKALGGDREQIKGPVRGSFMGYIFRGIMTYDEFVKHLKGDIDPEDMPSEKEVVYRPPGGSGDEQMPF